MLLLLLLLLLLFLRVRMTRTEMSWGGGGRGGFCWFRVEFGDDDDARVQRIQRVRRFVLSTRLFFSLQVVPRRAVVVKIGAGVAAHHHLVAPLFTRNRRRARIFRTTIALWSGTNKNRDVSTGPLARPVARSLAPLTRRKVNFSCLKMTWFCPIVPWGSSLYFLT